MGIIDIIKSLIKGKSNKEKPSIKKDLTTNVREQELCDPKALLIMMKTLASFTLEEFIDFFENQGYKTDISKDYHHVKLTYSEPLKNLDRIPSSIPVSEANINCTGNFKVIHRSYNDYGNLIKQSIYEVEKPYEVKENEDDDAFAETVSDVTLKVSSSLYNSINSESIKCESWKYNLTNGTMISHHLENEDLEPIHIDLSDTSFSEIKPPKIFIFAYNTRKLLGYTDDSNHTPLNI